MFENRSNDAMTLRIDPRAGIPLETTAALPDDEVQVWRVNLDVASPDILCRAGALLSVDELARAERFYLERDRRRFIIGRGLLRRLLGCYLDFDPRWLKFNYNVHGKPRLAAPAGAHAIFFNVTHADSLALFAITRVGEVGIDIERIRDIPGWEQIAAGCFTPAERQQLHLIRADERQREFFRIWTRHEAILKAAGSGLGSEIVDLEHKFSIHGLRLTSDCVATLALGGKARRIRCSPWLAHDALTNFFADRPAELTMPLAT